MTRFIQYFTVSMIATCLLWAVSGCGQNPQPNDGLQSTSDTSQESLAGNTEPNSVPPPPSENAHQHHPHGGIQLAGGEVDTSAGVTTASYIATGNNVFDATFNALKPLQVLVGSWKGVTSKAIGGAKAVETPQWSWDFLSDPDEPTLVFTSQTGPYLREARLTYRYDVGHFQLIALDAAGNERSYEGRWSQDPQETTDLNGQRQRTFELKLVEVGPYAEGEHLTLSMKDNDHYHLGIHRGSGATGTPYDTVETSRLGNPVIIDPAQLGKFTCLVSGGMGRVPIFYRGKTFYTCCEGCKAAFEADPQRWMKAYEKWNQRR